MGSLSGRHHASQQQGDCNSRLFFKMDEMIPFELNSYQLSDPDVCINCQLSNVTNFCVSCMQTRICLGHYANKGLGAPAGASRMGTAHFFLVELTDDSKSRISGERYQMYCVCTPSTFQRAHLSG